MIALPIGVFLRAGTSEHEKVDEEKRQAGQKIEDAFLRVKNAFPAIDQPRQESEKSRRVD